MVEEKTKQWNSGLEASTFSFLPAVQIFFGNIIFVLPTVLPSELAMTFIYAVRAFSTAHTFEQAQDITYGAAARTVLQVHSF